MVSPPLDLSQNEIDSNFQKDITTVPQSCMSTAGRNRSIFLGFTREKDSGNLFVPLSRL
jgi:hypothetical protein